MHTVNRTVLLPYSASEMFELVAAVDKYPEFMPWCGGAIIHEQSEHGMRASVTIQFAGLKQQFTTQNEHDFPHLIKLNLVEGPFSNLHGRWEFIELGQEACKVVFTLEYEFSNLLIEKIIGPVFNKITNTFIDSFTQRAQSIYGER